MMAQNNYPILGYELAEELDTFFFRFTAYGKKSIWQRIGKVLSRG